MDDLNLPLDMSSAYALIRRGRFWQQLIRRDEESIADIVPIDFEHLAQKKADFIGDRSLTDVLQEMNWAESDLDLHLHLPDALQRFASARFSPGLEEDFLSAGGSHDQIMYSLLRARDQGLIKSFGFDLRRARLVLSMLLRSMEKVLKPSVEV